MHFRKAGIPIPPKVISSDLAMLTSVVNMFDIKRVVFLGDLFHSQYNSEWLIFQKWLDQFPKISFELVLGNHDIHAQELLPSQIKLHLEKLEEPPFILTHEPIENYNGELYNLCGHLHPAVQLKGKGNQQMKLPCFHFGSSQGVLPAFGRFTGNMAMSIKKGDDVFAIASNKVMKVC